MTEVIFICLIRLETHIFALRFLHDLVLSSNMEALSWKASNKKFDSYNTFLLSLFQSSDSEEEGQQQLGFIFSDNKFGSDPTLPFGALALPAFDLVQDSHHYVDVRENHFRCDCDRVSEEKKRVFYMLVNILFLDFLLPLLQIAWLIGAAVHDFDRGAVDGDEEGYD